jgi:hypothetical protein
MDRMSSTDSPLPLAATPFETYMLSDDRADYPMTFVIQLEFSGTLKPQQFENALSRALTRHPLLQARVERRFRSWYWVPALAWRPLCAIVTRDQPPPHADSPPLDLRQGPGVRFWLQYSADSAQVTAEFHHACSDGIGALQFFGDVLSAYDAEVMGNSDPIAWGPLDPAQLTTRGRPRWRPPPEPISTWQAVRGFLAEMIRWSSRRPRPLVTSGEGLPGKPSRRRTAFAEILTETISPEDVRRLRTVARKQRVTLNDWLVRDVFATLAAWNLHRGGRSTDWLVVTMPTSLRQSNDSSLPATNVIGYAFLSRRLAECARENELLFGLAEETKAIRKWGLGMLALEGLAIAARIPGAMAWITRRSACQATAVFSNLGDPQRRMNSGLARVNGKIRAGDLVLERVMGAPPLRPKTHAVFLASQSGDELTLCLSYDAHRLTAKEGRQLLGSWTERLRSAIALPSLVGNGLQEVEPQNDSSGSHGGQ